MKKKKARKRGTQKGSLSQKLHGKRPSVSPKGGEMPQVLNKGGHGLPRSEEEGRRKDSAGRWNGSEEQPEKEKGEKKIRLGVRHVVSSTKGTKKGNGIPQGVTALGPTWKERGQS